MKLDLKELLNKLVNNEVYYLKKQQSVSMAAGASSVTVTYSLPTGATIMSISIATQPNANWIHCGINSYSNTGCTVAYNNTYSAAITGTIELDIIYRL